MEKRYRTFDNNSDIFISFDDPAEAEKHARLNAKAVIDTETMAIIADYREE